MATKLIRKNFHLMVDGYGYAGQVEDFTPPKLSLKTEDFQGGGMMAPIAVTLGMEKLEAEFTLTSYDPKILASFGVREGSNTAVTLREALEDYDGTLTGAAHIMRGKVTEIDPGTIKVGDKSTLKIKMALRYYKNTVGATVTQEIDVENMIHRTNGVDMLAAVRNLIGI